MSTHFLSSTVIFNSFDISRRKILPFQKKVPYLHPQYGGIAQLARASALQAEGRRFDSDYLHKKNDLHGRFFCWR